MRWDVEYEAVYRRACRKKQGEQKVYWGQMQRRYQRGH